MLVGVDGGKILLVDDEPAIRVLVARQLGRLGFTPVVAATGEEALALSQNEAFRVVITDLEMSGMGGLALLQRLSPLQPQARFLVLTGRGPVAGELLPRGHRIKIFSKPWDERELAAAVRGTDAVGAPTAPSAAALQAWPKTNILLIEEDDALAMAFCAELDARQAGQFVATVAADAATAAQLIEHQTFDLIVLAISACDVSALEAIARLQGEAPHVGVVVVAPADDAKFAAQAIQAGAQDCLAREQLASMDVGRALRNAAERKRAEWRLARIAFHDPLTGLANRSLFRQRVAQAAAFAKRSHSLFAVLVLDLDRFKFINDALGHDSGDAFLQEVAHRLQVATRETDTVARLGGDEFAVLATPVTHADDLEPLSERILAELRRPMDIGGTQLEPTASIGAAIFPESGGDSDALLSAADAALYVVKQRGRDGFHVHGVELKRRVARKVQIEKHLRRAVERRQFYLHYQPQVSPDSGFWGAEALLRWDSSGDIATEPSEFVPILEESGLIMQLGPWIIETACRQLREWRDSGLWVDRVAINISGRQVLARDFVSFLRSVTRDLGIASADVELELTESTLLHDTAGMREVLRVLAEDGYRLALDDFGTGYSSLAYLRNFPISTLKIDKTFVQSIASDVHDRNLVVGILRLAHELGLQVVAEGVETPQQLEVLRAEACHVVQGYLFGAAMAPDAYATELMRLAMAPRDVPPPQSAVVSRSAARPAQSKRAR